MESRSLDVPQGLRRDRHVEAVHAQPWGRRIGLVALCAVAIAGLFNVFGQRPTTSTASAAAATLTVRVPDRLRGGLVYQGRITVLSRRNLSTPRLVLDRGWLEGATLNSMEPGALAESQERGGRIVLALPPLHAGIAQTYWLQMSMNPTTVGQRSQGVELDNGTTPVVRVHRTLTVFP